MGKETVYFDASGGEHLAPIHHIERKVVPVNSEKIDPTTADPIPDWKKTTVCTTCGDRPVAKGNSSIR